jgi:FkbM family methyltransferase
MLRDNTLLGKWLRLPLRAIPRDAVVPVLSGPLRGRRWVAGASVHGCWLGWYERNTAKEFSRLVSKEAVVWDIGANVGYYSLIAARRAPLGSVVAFEPLPANVALLRRHLELNQMRNVTVIEAAVSDHEGVGHFEEHANNSRGHLVNRGGLRITLVTMDLYLNRHQGRAPELIKMDVEGAEFDALLGGRSLLAAYHPTIVLATHSAELHQACCVLLQKLDYAVKTLNFSRETGCGEVVARHRD